MSQLLCPVCNGPTKNGKQYHDECSRPGVLPVPAVVHALEVTGVDIAVFQGRARGSLDEQAREREKVWLWLRDNTEMSYPEIAKATNMRTHTTIIAGVRRIRARIAAGMEVLKLVNDLANGGT